MVFVSAQCPCAQAVVACACSALLGSQSPHLYRPIHLRLTANSAECIHSQDFAGVTWMFSFEPFLESCYVTGAGRGLRTVHFIIARAISDRASHAL
jgi:hypothetical protein